MLTVTATDVMGNVGSSSVTFDHDVLTLSAIEPLPFSVATPSIHLSITCSDHADGGCASLTASVDGGSMVVVATGTSSIDATVSLARFQGQAVGLMITGADGNNHQVAQTVPLWVDGSPRLFPLLSVGGPILDIDTRHVLYRDPQAHLHVFDAPSTAYQQVPDVAGATLDGRLIQTGALLFTDIGTPFDFVYEWQGGAVDSLDFYIPGTFGVSANFGAWVSSPANSNTLVREDLTTESRSLLRGASSSDGTAVTVGGDLVYGATSGLQFYGLTSGGPVSLTQGDDHFPSTDGVNVIFVRRGHPSDEVSLIGFDGGATTSLGTVPDSTFGLVLPGSGLQTREGWSAFVSQSGGALQAFVRSPAGNVTQASIFGTDSALDELAPDGTLAFTNQDVPSDGGRYVAAPGATAEFVSSALGKAYWRNGHWLIAIGRTLFCLGPADGGTGNCLGWPSDGGTSTFEVPDAGLDGGTVTLDGGGEDGGSLSFDAGGAVPDGGAPRAIDGGISTGHGRGCGGCQSSSSGSLALALLAALGLLLRAQGPRAASAIASRKSTNR